jgi:hypothetical protein
MEAGAPYQKGSSGDGRQDAIEPFVSIELHYHFISP